MKRLRQLRMALMSFGAGLLLGKIDPGLKVCIITPLIILWVMSYDFKSERRIGYEWIRFEYKKTSAGTFGEDR